MSTPEMQELWKRLSAPLDGGMISWRIDGKPTLRDGRHFARFVAYCDVPNVIKRLDSVVPGEWDFSVRELPNASTTDGEANFAVVGSLQVLGVRREDVGQGPDYKQATTDAMKRAARMFGIALELWEMEPNWVQVDGDGKYAKAVEDPQVAYDRRYKKGSGSANPTSNGTNGHRSGETSSSRGTSTTPTASAGRTNSAKPTQDASPASPTPTQADELGERACPKCSGRMFDNRATKKNPKAPDYKCRDRTCDGVIWPPRASATVGAVNDEYDEDLGF